MSRLFFVSALMLRNDHPTLIVGRPYVYGLALKGEAGVEAVLKTLLSDLSVTMGLIGYQSLTDVRSTLSSNMIHS